MTDNEPKLRKEFILGWVRLDDNFSDHPKVIALSDKAFRLFITGLCYSNRQLTDGLLPYQIVTGWVGDDPLKPSDELEDQNLWERVDKGFLIRSYTEYQPTREKVNEKRDRAKSRLKKYRDKQKAQGEQEPPDDFDDFDLELETRKKRHPQPNPTQPNPNKELELLEPEYGSGNQDHLPVAKIPRNQHAKLAVQAIVDKLEHARRNGINAWNLSKLVEEQWDELHGADDVGACIALTAWYVSELQSRKLTSAEIGRIGQMTKRFGRISLLAIDEAASKDLKDLLSYAFRVAQSMYAKQKA